MTTKSPAEPGTREKGIVSEPIKDVDYGEDQFRFSENSDQLVGWLETEGSVEKSDKTYLGSYHDRGFLNSYGDAVKLGLLAGSISLGYTIASNPAEDSPLRDLAGHTATGLTGAIGFDEVSNFLEEDERSLKSRAGVSALGGLSVDGAGQMMQEIGYVSGSFNPETWVFAGSVAMMYGIAAHKFESSKYKED